ncbi:hypothetical protein FISHEDRAFT_65439 [Fistulina hepatica ATCC 64428]|nr:hypothetical protein FISHEDRAFT_65439 [Fistulina hepatica ATCC 64428]
MHPLSPPTRTKLRSTQILTSLPQIVSELVQNSLDAGATSINVGVDCEEWICWVRDDGCGMSRSDMDLLSKGSDEGRYNSSKTYAPDELGISGTFGFRGEALSSAADLCCLEVSSRTSKSRESWSVILKARLRICCYHGKCLYQGPSVRWRRESPGTVVCVRDAFYNLPVRRMSHPSPPRVLELIKHELSTFALVFPGVSFSLENPNKVKQSSSSNPYVLRIPTSMYGFRYREDTQDPVDLNNHILARCDLHQFIDSCFASSTFGKNVDEEGDATLAYVRRSPRKSEKNPVYVLNILVPPKDVDNCLEPSKAAVHFRDRASVTSLLGLAIRSFLVANGFSTFREARQRESTGSPSHVNAVLQKVASPRRYRSLPLYISRGHENDSGTQTRLINWTDPNTGELYLIDERTGNTVRREFLQDERDVPPQGGTELRRTISMPKGISNTKREKPLEVPQWLQDALQANDVYEVQPYRMVFLSNDNSVPWYRRHDSCDKREDGHAINASYQFQRAALAGAHILGQVDRKFIACIMNEEEGGRSALVLIDQHAADERVRVERFLRELCCGFLEARRGHRGERSTRIKKAMLSPPLPVLLTRQEALRLKVSEGVRLAFEWWGVCFANLSEIADFDSDAGADAGTSGYAQLLQDEELRDLVKGYLAQLDGDLLGLVVPYWLTALPWCPKQLLDLINSKACRGAIMFNDTLSLTQCQKLVASLSTTSFPFQCAHGRCAMLAIFVLGAQSLHRRAVNWSSLQET